MDQFVSRCKSGKRGIYVRRFICLSRIAERTTIIKFLALNFLFGLNTWRLQLGLIHLFMNRHYGYMGIHRHFLCMTFM